MPSTRPEIPPVADDLNQVVRELEAAVRRNDLDAARQALRRLTWRVRSLKSSPDAIGRAKKHAELVCGVLERCTEVLQVRRDALAQELREVRKGRNLLEKYRSARNQLKPIFDIAG